MDERIAWALAPRTWRRAARFGAAVGLETVLAPWVWTALRVLPEERVLRVQNLLRRRALRWILPELPR